jgi:hypothetical protein
MNIPIPSNGLFIVEKGVLTKALLRPETSEVVVPAGVTKVGDMVFRGLPQLKKVTLPAGCKTIGVEAFADCDNLLEVVTPESLGSLQEYAFHGYRCLPEIKLAKGARMAYMALPESVHVIRVPKRPKIQEAEHQPLGLFKESGITLAVSYKYEKTPNHWKRPLNEMRLMMLDEAETAAARANFENQMSGMIDVQVTIADATAVTYEHIQAVLAKLPKHLFSERQVRIQGTNAHSQDCVPKLAEALVDAFGLEKTKTPELLLQMRMPQPMKPAEVDPNRAWPRRSFSPGGWSVHL